MSVWEGLPVSELQRRRIRFATKKAIPLSPDHETGSMAPVECRKCNQPNRLALDEMDDMQPRFGNVKFVFLDRDGVINRKALEGEYICNWQQFVLLPGVEEAIHSLNEAGKTVIVVTNQRGIALGKYTEEDLATIHRQLQDRLAASGAHIDAIYYCPHDKRQCDCRKPGIGMLKQAFQAFPAASQETSILIGDSLSDIQAAKTMGIRSIFIEGEPERRKPGAEQALGLADAVCSSLSEAASSID